MLLAPIIPTGNVPLFPEVSLKNKQWLAVPVPDPPSLLKFPFIPSLLLNIVFDASILPLKKCTPPPRFALLSAIVQLIILMVPPSAEIAPPLAVASFAYINVLISAIVPPKETNAPPIPEAVAAVLFRKTQL